MKRLIFSIISVIVLIAFLFSVNGVLVFNHTCFSCHSEETSLFIESHHEHCCATKAESHENSCCHDDHCTIDNIVKDIDNNCCDEDVELVRISIPFTSFSLDFTKIFDFIFIQTDFISYLPAKDANSFFKVDSPNIISLDKHMKFCSLLL